MSGFDLRQGDACGFCSFAKQRERLQACDAPKVLHLLNLLEQLPACFYSPDGKDANAIAQRCVDYMNRHFSENAQVGPAYPIPVVDMAMCWKHVTCHTANVMCQLMKPTMESIHHANSVDPPTASPEDMCKRRDTLRGIHRLMTIIQALSKGQS